MTKTQAPIWPTPGKRHLTPYERTHLARYQLAEAIAQAHPHQPVEYLTGRVEFAGLVLSLTPATLIPRPETEELVNEACLWLTSRQQQKSLSTLRVLEIGTGCGAIALALEQNCPAPLAITATDLSPEALQVARLNLQRFNSQRIHLRKNDLLDQWPKEEKYDLLIANLPYIPSARIAALDKSVKDYEPRLALDGGADGLSLVRRLLEQAPPHLEADGLVLLEIDYTHLDNLASELGTTIARQWRLETWISQLSRCAFARATLK